MRVAFLAVGSELLGPESVESNSLLVADVLAAHGEGLERTAVIGDEEAALGAEIERHLGIFDLVVVSGGLGPTTDDLTRRAIARACGRELAIDDSLVADIEAKFAAFDRTMPTANRRQAEIIEGAETIPNPNGTAPGQRLECDGTTLLLLPGVPREFEAMLGPLRDWLVAHGADRAVTRRTVKVACMAESEVENRLAPLYEDLGGGRLAVYSRPGDVRIVIDPGETGEEGEEELEEIVARVRALVGPAVYSDRGEELEAIVGELLRAERMTVATAESCTGGLVGARVTSVAGSSAWYVGGVVAYADDVKCELLGVPASMLVAEGAVSAPVAAAMAAGIRRRLGSDIGVAVTGIAGPSGGSDDKPVGLVHLALTTPDSTRCLEARLPGDRERVRRQAVQLALEMIRRSLIGTSIGVRTRREGATA